MRHSGKTLVHEDYTIGWIAALPLELAAAKMMLDLIHTKLPQESSDQNTYILGEIHGHNIAMACLPSGVYGTTSAAIVVAHMLTTFRAIRFVLMVGIGGGVPSTTADIRLGDVVVSKPSGTSGDVVQYDFGRTLAEGRFQRVGCLNKPPQVLLTAVSELEAHHLTGRSQVPANLLNLHKKCPKSSRFKYCGQDSDHLYEATYDHIGQDTCENCDKTKLAASRGARSSTDPQIHYGLIASGNQVMKHAAIRDKLASSENPAILCFEMEAAGLMDQVPCLVIRGICDYSDSHKNKQWQGYAAATAAAYAKELLQVVSSHRVLGTSRIRDIETFSMVVMTLTASIVGFLGISGSILAGISTHSSAKVSLGVLKDVVVQLPLITESLEKIAAGCKNGSIRLEDQTSLLPVVNGCLKRASALGKLIQEISPMPNDSKLSRIRKLVLRPFRTKTVDSCLSALEGYKSTLAFHLQEIARTQMHDIAESNSRQEDEMAKVRRQQIRSIIIQLLKPSMCFNSVSSLPGTCQWIWNEPNFIQWTKQSPDTKRLLFVQGISGCGKSVLATSVAETFQKKGVQVLFFSLRGTESDRRTLDSLFRTFIFQLLEKVSDEKASEYVEGLSRKISPGTPALFEDLLDLVKSMNETVYCIIDGVDECMDKDNNPDSDLLINYAYQMIENPNFHVALFGRPCALQNAIRPPLALNVEINFDLIKEDINLFICSQVEGCTNLKDEGLRGHVFKVLLDGSGGMFLWIELMCAELRKSITAAGIMDQLHNIPEGLEELYRGRFLRLLTKLDRQGLILAKKVLTFIIASGRRMTIDELWYSIALDKETEFHLGEELLIPLERTILDACADLVNITNDHVQLIHFSIQEFLTRPREKWSCDGDQKIESSFRVDVNNAHLSLASVCIEYLSTCDYEFPVDEPGDASNRQSDHPFLEYSSQYAIFHSVRSGDALRPKLSTNFDVFVGSRMFIPWVEYLSMLMVEDGYLSALILDDIEDLRHWLEESDANLEAYLQKLSIAFEQNLEQRTQEASLARTQEDVNVATKANLRAERLRLMYDYVQVQISSELEDSRDVDLEFVAESSPTPRDTSLAISQTINLIKSNTLAPLPAGLHLLLGLQTHLSRVKVLCDPLKLLFETILGMAEKIPAPVLLVIGNFYYNLEKFDQALRVYKAALSKKGHVYGFQRITLLNRIGLIVSLLAGDIEAQRDCFTQALQELKQYRETREPHLLRDQHFSMEFVLIKNIGNVFYNLGEYLQAEKMFREAAEGRGKLLGSEHRATLRSVRDLAGTLYFQDRYLEAAKEYKRACNTKAWLTDYKHGTHLSVQEKVYNDEILQELGMIYDLGNHFSDQEKYPEAEAMFLIAAESLQEVLGYENLETLDSVHKLGIALYRQGRYPEAELKFRSAMEGCQKMVGTADHRTLYSIEGVTSALLAQGRNSEAEAMLQIILGVEELEEILKDHTNFRIIIQEICDDLGVDGLETDEQPEAGAAYSFCSTEDEYGTDSRSEYEPSEESLL
ncbi:hypothetical protein TWF788_007698 [Orbilia oligospora]|uniref:NACHT domain-containing protein n=1 Tax=Orbilia oligospora TaxID=2813651 RepID=A0A7C8PS09_ORBOL|nr:hypothetical protein TWF788_007698 [Orbilia oligospora]